MRLRTFVVFALTLLVGSGCDYFPESCFDLAPESRLPNWFTLPTKVSRTEVSINMCYYIKSSGRFGTFVLRDAKGEKIAEVTGRQKGLEPLELKNPPSGFPPGYPSYEVITANGVTEVIEHRKLEPVFYITDSPKVLAELGVSRAN